MNIFKSIRIFTLFLTLILTFSACSVDDSGKWSDEDVKQELNKRTFYHVDSSTNTYQKFTFDDNKFLMYEYEDKYMKNLKDKKSYHIVYDKKSFDLISSDKALDQCNVTFCNNDQFVIITCNGNIISCCGWETQAQALADDKNSY